MVQFVPQKHIAFLLGLMAFQFLFVGADLVRGTGLDTDIQTPSIEGDGADAIVEAFASVIGFINDIVTFTMGVFHVLGKLLAFSTIEGMPVWVRIPFSLYSIFVVGLLLVDIATTLAGALPGT